MDNAARTSWLRLKDLFERARAVEPTARAALLDEACRDDAADRVQIEQLLANYDRAIEFFDAFPDLAVAASRLGTHTFSSGQTVADRFRILDFLGEGGMGEVYEAEDLQLAPEHTALKTLRGSVADERSIGRLSRELQLARHITHPNVCRVHDVGQHQTPSGVPVHFFTMELLRGETLAGRIAHGPLEMAQALPIVRQIAAALDAAHAAGVVHGDLKPGNVMLVANGVGHERVVVTDFGLARWLPTATALLSTTSESIGWGTPAYMAPEQLLGGPVTPAADIYALGILVYEMVTGKHPFVADSGLEIAWLKMRERPRPPREHASQLGTRWQDAILRCLELDPQQRFGSAVDVIHAIEGTASRSRLRAWVIGAVAAAAIASTGALAIPAVRTVVTDEWATLTGSDREQIVAVLPFVDATSTPDGQALSVGLTAAVTDQLAAFVKDNHRFFIVPSSQVIETGIGTPALARHTLGATLIVTGRVAQQAGGTAIDLAVSTVTPDGSGVDTRRNEIVVATDQRGSLTRSVSRNVASLLRVRAPDNTERGVTVNASPVPMAAERAYLMGRGYLAQGGPGLSTAIDALNEAIQDVGIYPAAHAALGEAYLKLYAVNRDRTAIAQAQAHSETATTQDPNDARTHLINGRVYQTTGQHQRAIREFQAALEINPEETEARRYLAIAYETAGEPDAAEAEYRKTVQLRPRFWQVYEDYGVFLFQQGRYREAEENFVRGTEYAPGNVRAMTNLAAVYLMQGRYAAAENELRKAPDSANDDLVFAQLGWAYIFEGKFTDATDALKKAVTLPGASSNTWSSLARAYRWEGKHPEDQKAAYAKALQLADEELRVNPVSAGTRSNRAYLLAESGRAAEAQQEIVAAKARAPGNTTVLFRSALVHELAGDRSGALEELMAAARGGHSSAEIQAHPDLAALRTDPKYPPVFALASHERTSR
jgi:eukaryotic-like serine/threonine-protein kinase